jgi:hypothetical protein
MKNIVIAKDRVDATKTTNPNDFIYHSAYNTFKILKQAKSDQTISGAGDAEYTVTIAHGMGSITSFLAYVYFSDGWSTMVHDGYAYAYTYTVGDLSGATEGYARAAYIDATNIGITFYKPYAADMEVQIVYYIFETPLA